MDGRKANLLNPTIIPQDGKIVDMISIAKWLEFGAENLSGWNRRQQGMNSGFFWASPMVGAPFGATLGLYFLASSYIN